MAETVMFTNAPEFRLWIQRTLDEEPPFRLRWQVMDGRGTLLLPRGGGTDAAPASSSGTQRYLSSTDLMRTRFLVVSDRGGERNQFDVGPFPKEGLGALEVGAWHALTMNEAATSLVLPAAPEAEPDLELSPADPAQDRILELEGDLARAQQRVSALTRRVADLEGQIDGLTTTSEPSKTNPHPERG